MNKEDIHLTDVHRILFGTTPVMFLVEVFLRTVLAYTALLVLLKLLGKRMDGKITIIEMAIMLTLGAIAAAAFNIPDKGIMAACVALVTVFLVHRSISWL